MTTQDETATSVAWTPAWRCRPAASVIEMLVELDLSPAQLAARCGLTAARMGDLLLGSPIGENDAVGLERGTGVPAKFWVNLQRLYTEAGNAGLPESP